MNQVFQDLHYGLRLMRKSPGFSAAAVLTIALGIAAATAIFSVVYGVELQPLACREPHRLVPAGAGDGPDAVAADRVNGYFDRTRLKTKRSTGFNEDEFSN